MTDFFSEFLHISQIYTLNNEEEPEKQKEEGPEESGQVLISQRTRKRKEQDQINEIIDLYTQKISKEDEVQSQDSPKPSFTPLK